MSSFAPSRREQMRLRMALQGPAGSGKTNTAMIVARGLSPDGTFAVIDTENRALEYADRFSFLHCAPAEADPGKLPGLVAEAAAAGVGALVLDSFSHYWSGVGGALDRVDRSRDKRAGWSEYRPVEAAMMRALLTFPGHVIVTLRVKTEYVTEVDPRGKTTTRRVGLKADQRDSVDYEFSVIGEMDTDHSLTVVKTTCPALVDQCIDLPGEPLVDTLREWLGQGDPVMDVREIRDKAIDQRTTADELREMWRDAKRRHLLGAPLLDELGMSTTLGDLFGRLAKERTPVPTAPATTDGQEATK